MGKETSRKSCLWVVSSWVSLIAHDLVMMWPDGLGSDIDSALPRQRSLEGERLGLLGYKHAYVTQTPFN